MREAVRGGCTGGGVCVERQQAAAPLRVQDHKRLIENQNSHQLFNRYRVNQLWRRRLGDGGGGVVGGGSCMGKCAQACDVERVCSQARTPRVTLVLPRWASLSFVRRSLSISRQEKSKVSWVTERETANVSYTHVHTHNQPLSAGCSLTTTSLSLSAFSYPQGEVCFQIVARFPPVSMALHLSHIPLMCLHQRVALNPL